MRNGADSTRWIEHALRRLLPDIFFHPIWTLLVETGEILSREQVQSLMNSASQLLSDGQQEDACQVLFTCAYQQLRVGDDEAASNSIQQVMDLAERHELSHVAACGAWGAAAVSARRGRYPQAAEHLAHLQFILGQQHDWVLADTIDVIRRALLSQPEVTAIERLSSSDAALSSAFEQMLHWGTLRTTREFNFTNGPGGCADQPTRLPVSSTGFSWRSLWHSMKRVVKGELRLRWVEAGGSTPLLDSDERRALITEELPAAASATTREPVPATFPVLLRSESESSDMTGPEFVRPTPETHPSKPKDEKPYKPSLAVFCLGPFRVYQDNQLVTEWKSLKGYSILKYLVTHGRKPIAKDILMDVFWPDAVPAAARRNLHQAIYALRQMLNQSSLNPQQIQFENDGYLLNPELDVWLDFEEFEQHVQAGRRLEAAGQIAEAMTEYAIAEGLYQGDFLEEDLYEDWPGSQREHLRNTYVEITERLSEYYVQQRQYTAGVTLCHKVLERDPCHEESHRRLMQCYLAQGQRHLAIRQYHICVQALAKELDVPPADETRKLYASISAKS